MFTLSHGENNVWYGTFSRLTQLKIKHAVSTRLGGISHFPYSSLNLGLHTGDEQEKVIENRRRFCQAIEVNHHKLVTAEQVHGDHITVVTENDIGKGAIRYHESIQGADALITNIPAIPLMLFFADCVPVLLYDPVKHVIGVSHAGWKGTVAKITQKTVLAMAECYHTKPEDCIACIAPSIGPCCYEVDEIVLNKLQNQFANWESLVTASASHWQLDLWEANRTQLREIGLKEDNLITSGICTACNNQLFFSYRAEQGKTGRIAACISL